MSKIQLGQSNNSVFNKTLQYAERFNKYGYIEDFEKGAQKGVKIRKCLAEAKLDNDEEELLINLLPMKSEEAITLIPSLRDK